MMTPQESEALRGFLGQLTQVQGITKDAQAAAMIATAFSQQPDAGYLLVQRAMLLDQALVTARSQIDQLQNQLQAERDQSRTGSAGSASSGSGGGFLDPASSWGRGGNDLSRASGSSGLAGRRDGPGQAPQPGQRTDQRYDTAAPYASAQAPMQAPAQRPGLFGGGGGGSGFLGSMAATAAGVAGGAFLFQGLSGLMGNHGSGLMGDHGAAKPAENTTVNNFYDSAPDTAADTAADAPARLSSNADNGSMSDGLDSGIDDLAGNDDFDSQDDSSSV